MLGANIAGDLTVGGHSICLRRLVSHFAIGGALLSLPCVRGGAALRAAEGLYLTKTIFLFLFCKLHIFTIPQALARQLPLHKGALRANDGRPAY